MEPLEFSLSTDAKSSSIFDKHLSSSPLIDSSLRPPTDSRSSSSSRLESELSTLARTSFLDEGFIQSQPGLTPSNFSSFPDSQEPQLFLEPNDTLLRCDPAVSIAAANLDSCIEEGPFLNTVGLTQFSQAESVVPLALQSLTTQLEKFANGANFVEQMRIAFGDSWDAESAGTLLQEIISGEKFPKIQVVKSADLDTEGKSGTYGAFSIDTNTIYLSREFLTQYSHNSGAVTTVLLEELGHYIDSQLNQSDSPGDEGNIFAKLVQSQLTEAELPALKTENDHAVVKIGGHSIGIEQASPWSRGANGLAAQYFDNKNFTGIKTTRTDPTVNFDWGSNSPHAAMDKDLFSVRWLGQVQSPQTGTFTFYTKADDGVRLWVNGKLLIDNWTDHSATENSGRIDLVAGQKYDIKLEYYENRGLATTQLSWSSPTIQKQIIPQSRLYSGDLSRIGFDGASAHDTYISTYERNGSLSALGYPLNNVHRWGNGYVQDFDRGSNDRGAIMKSDVNDNSYWVGGKFWKTYLSASGADGLLKYPTSDVYNSESGSRQNFQGGAILQSQSGTYTVYGAIGSKYLQLGAESSYLGFPVSKESRRSDGWTRQKFEGGYILWKEGQAAIAYSTPDTTPIPSNWQGSSSNWRVQFWNNKELTGTPVWERTDRRGAISFNASLGAPQDTRGVQEDNFSARWSTRSYFQGGFYDLISEADDGVRVYVDGIKVIDKWSATEPWSRQDGFVLIPKGNHDVVVEYFEEGGVAGQTFQWKQSNLQRGWTGALIPVGFDGGSINSTYTQTYIRNGSIPAVGSPSNNVHVWGNGYTQDFSGGSDGSGAIMKSNANNNSYWVGGSSWSTFLNTGGADGILGYPTSDRYSVNGGWKQDFQGGAILSSSKGTFPVFGGVGYQYLHFEGGPKGRLGYPTSGELGLGNGVIIQNFENGYVLYGKGATRTVINGQEIAVGYDGSGVNSTYTTTFDRVGSWDVVGSASNNVHVWGNGYTQDFSGGSDGSGAIMKSNANNNSYWVGGSSWSTFLNTGGADGILGYPTSDRYSVNGGWKQDFQGGAILSSSKGTFPVFGGVGYQYLHFEGGPKGRLGYPTSGELGLGNGVIIQNFENGYVLYGKGATRTVINGQEIAVGYDGSGVNSTYTTTFDRVGSWDVVGSASNNVHVWGNGYTQDFSGGSDGSGAIMKSNANNNSYWVGGDFWNTFLNTGGAGGILGYPTSDRYSTIKGALRQDFQGGAIYKTSRGIFTVFGGIGNYYLTKTASEGGKLGLPTSGEIGLGNGIVRQNFDNGYIVWKNGSAVGYNPDGSLLFPPPTSGGSNGGTSTSNSGQLVWIDGAYYIDGQPVDFGTLPRTGGAVDALVNIGSFGWNLMKDTQINSSTGSASALPDGQWYKVNGESRGTWSYEFKAVNTFGQTLYDINVDFSLRYGGSIDGVGKYITSVSANATKEYINFFNLHSLTINLRFDSPGNVGTEGNPIATLPFTLTLDDSVFYRDYRYAVVKGEIRGDGIITYSEEDRQFW